jgi:hypothetical protein
MKVRFPEVLDSTIIASFRECEQKSRMEYFLHYKPKAPSIHLHAGGAYAAGLEAARRAFYEQDQDAETSIALGMQTLTSTYGDFDGGDSNKSLDRMQGALLYYFDTFPLDQDPASPIQLPAGRRGIEWSFAEPLPFIHPDTGNPLIYAGRMDMLVDFAGAQYVLDDKTTSSLGSSWARQWELRSQFSGYCWAARKAGIPVKGAIVRGVSILKTKYDNAVAVTNRADWEIERWESMLHSTIRRMLNSYATSSFDYNLDHSCANYGSCLFAQVCKSPNPQEWLDVQFSRRVWNPLTREEEAVE